MNSVISWLLSASDNSATTPVAICILRIGTGLAIARYHGWHKLVDGVRWKKGLIASWPFAIEISEAGFPFIVESAWLVAALQFIGGICIMLGILTRPFALVIIGSLLGAVFTTIRLHKDSQPALLYLLLHVSVCGLGSGPLALDAVFFR